MNWHTVRKAVPRLERALLGDFRSYALGVGLLFVASALLVAVVAFFKTPTAAPLFGLAAAALAASGGALSALWAAAARVVVTREAARGALLSQLLQLYYSRPMSEASYRCRWIRDAATVWRQESLRDYLDSENGEASLLKVYAPLNLGQVREALNADGRLLEGFFVNVHRLCELGFLPEEDMRHALGEHAVRLYLDAVDPLDLRYASGNAVQDQKPPLDFFGRWRDEFRAEAGGKAERQPAT